jgi:hypothetical protein
MLCYDYVDGGIFDWINSQTLQLESAGAPPAAGKRGGNQLELDMVWNWVFSIGSYGLGFTGARWID